MRARQYSAELGRFTSRDPIGFAGGINLYAYTENSPLNYVDRFGKEKALILAAEDTDLYGISRSAIQGAIDSEVNRLLEMGIKGKNIHIGQIRSIADIQE